MFYSWFRNFDNLILVSAMKTGLEYAEEIMEQMIENEERYQELFISLTELLNDELISPDVFLQTVYPVYRDFLNKHSIRN